MPQIMLILHSTFLTMLTLCQMNFNMKLPDRIVINEDYTVKTISPVQLRPPPHVQKSELRGLNEDKNMYLSVLPLDYKTSMTYESIMYYFDTVLTDG